jgi:phage FluMu gp28-like protein
MVVAPVVRLSLPDDFVQQTESERRDHVEAWVSTHLDMPLKRLDASRVTAIGMDFGRSSDISVIVPLVLEQDMVRSCPFVVEMRNVPFRQQEQVLFYVCDKLPRFTAGKIDAGGNGQYIAEAASLRYGQGRMEEVHLSDRRYSELLPPLRAAFEDRTIRIPRDADILSDLRQFQMINGVPKLPKHRQTSRIDHKPRHGDAGVAFALAYDASRAEVPEIAYEPVRPRGMWAGRRGAL